MKIIQINIKTCKKTKQIPADKLRSNALRMLQVHFHKRNFPPSYSDQRETLLSPRHFCKSGCFHFCFFNNADAVPTLSVSLVSI